MSLWKLIRSSYKQISLPTVNEENCCLCNLGDKTLFVQVLHTADMKRKQFKNNFRVYLYDKRKGINLKTRSPYGNN